MRACDIVLNLSAEYGSKDSHLCEYPGATVVGALVFIGAFQPSFSFVFGVACSCHIFLKAKTKIYLAFFEKGFIME